MTTTEVPPQAAHTHPDSPPPTATSETRASASAPPDVASETAPRTPDKRAKDPGLMVALLVAAAIGGITVGLIGFATSYTTLAHVAGDWGFGEGLAYWFPVGVDASIVAFLALDLYLIHKDTPWPLLRLAAHGMTGATIWFNASAQGSIQADPVQAAAHGVMPVLFVIGVEAARRLFIKKAKLASGTATDAIPFHRWILRPLNTPKFYRRMRLWGITSYPEMIVRDQELIAYELWLKRKYKGDLSKATEDERLPMTMAPYGYTVEQALAMPDEQDRAAKAREEAAKQRQEEAETRQQELTDQHTARREESQASLKAKRAALAAEEAAEETARTAEARARTAAAERRAAEDEQAAAAAARTAAEERAKEAAALRQAENAAAAEEAAEETARTAEARKRSAEANRRAAEAEKHAAEDKARAAEARAREEAALEAAERSKKAAAEAAKDAAEAEERAAEKRLRVAEIEQRAAEKEDAARLTPRQRAARKVARMVLHQAGGDYTALPLAAIQNELGVSSPGTASEYRQEAAQLLVEGYQP